MGPRGKQIGIIGAGMSGLVASTQLAKLGHSVHLFERAKYPGGTAGYYEHRGLVYPTGATIAFGMEPTGPLRGLLGAVGIDLDARPMNLSMDVVLADRVVHVYSDEAQWQNELARAFPERTEDVLRFWAHLRRTAAAVYRTSKAFAGLPIRRPVDLGRLPVAVLTSPGEFLRLIPEMRWTVEDALRRYALADYEPFKRFLNAQLVDAAQTDVTKAAWLPSSIALDIYRQGVYAVQGGFARIAQSLLERATHLGTTVLMPRTIQSAQYDAKTKRWALTTHRRETFSFDAVINTTGLPILGAQAHPSGVESPDVRDDIPAWGAVRLDALVPSDWLRSLALPVDTQTDPFALQISNDHTMSKLFQDPHGATYVTIHPETSATAHQVITVSVHTPAADWMALEHAEYATHKMRTLETLMAAVDGALPGFQEHAKEVRVGTPRTYQRYLLKPTVGGTPLTVHSSILHPVGPRTRLPGWFLAGDTVFPGPGTLSAALSGFFAARAIDPRVRNPH